MSLPAISLLASFTDLQKKLSHVQHQLLGVQNEYKTLLSHNQEEISTAQSRLTSDFQTKLDLEQLEKDLHSLRLAEADLRRNIIVAAEKAFDDYVNSGQYKVFVDEQIVQLGNRFGAVTVNTASNTNSFVSKSHSTNLPNGQLRVSALDGKITAIFDPAEIRTQVVEKLLPVAFAS